MCLVVSLSFTVLLHLNPQLLRLSPRRSSRRRSKRDAVQSGCSSDIHLPSLCSNEFSLERRTFSRSSIKAGRALLLTCRLLLVRFHSFTRLFNQIANRWHVACCFNRSCDCTVPIMACLVQMKSKYSETENILYS